MSGPVTAAAAVGAGLVAGVFGAFSVAVMPALDRLPAERGVAVMQTVNTVIVRPAFLTVLCGTALTCVAAVVTAPGQPRQAVGAALYLVGAFGVTVAVNVPLNTALAAADPGDPERAWDRYSRRWTAWNHVRTLAAAAAAAVLTSAV